MKRFLVIGSLALAVATLGPSAWAGCPLPVATPFVVPPGTVEIELPALLPQVAGAWATLVEEPLHGELIVAAGTAVYRPSSSFWTLGSDRVLLRVGAPAQPTATVAVRLLARTARDHRALQDFESAMAPDEWPISGACQLSSSARLGGGWGLVVTAGGVGTNTSLSKHTADPGGSNQGSGGNGGWRPPGGGGGGGWQGGFGFTEATLLSLESEEGWPRAAWVRMRQDGAGLRLRLETPSSSPAEPWLPITADPHTLSLLADGDSAGGGAQLYLDGELLASASSPWITEEVVQAAKYAFGLADVVGDPVTTHFDQLTVFSQLNAEWRCADDFEAATLQPEWGVVGAGALARESSGMSDDGVLAVSPHLGGSPAGGLLTHAGLAPLDIERMGVRLAFDPSELTVPPGASLLLAGAANHFGTRAFRVVIEGLGGGALQMKVIVRPDSITAPQPTASFALSRAPHTLELDWWRSETDVVGTGTVRLWLDGQEQAELLGLHNPNQTITEVGFGALTLAGAPSGKLLLDDIDFWYE